MKGRMLDRGALGLGEDRAILVSQHVHGGETVHDLLLRFSGRPLRPPQEEGRRPAERYVAWHRREVFREPPRVAG